MFTSSELWYNLLQGPTSVSALTLSAQFSMCWLMQPENLPCVYSDVASNTHKYHTTHIHFSFRLRQAQQSREGLPSLITILKG